MIFEGNASLSLFGTSHSFPYSDATFGKMVAVQFPPHLDLERFSAAYQMEVIVSIQIGEPIVRRVSDGS